MSLRHLSSVSLLEQCLLGAAGLALIAMLSLPAMRDVSNTFGWLPFWLLALPLTAWAVARALRQRGQRETVLPMATVHPISVARPSVNVADSHALRRAA